MFHIDAVRSQFPALSRRVNGRPAAYLDGPGGTQTPRAVIDAISSALAAGVSNLGGQFASSEQAVEITEQSRRAAADLLGASRPEEIVFGQNMTSLTFAVSRAIAATWLAGDEVIVTRLDHDANRTPWILAARDRGAKIREVRFDGDGLDYEHLGSLLSPRTKLVAFTAASNALGTLVDVRRIATMAHEVGALCYVDSVHNTPHLPVDVTAWGCDFLVTSAYKFFGPHTGILYGRHALLENLEAYKLIPAPAHPPGKWETGTQSFEALAGVTAAVEYLASLGEGADRRTRLLDGYANIGEHEASLSTQFLKALDPMSHVRLFGPRGGEGRTPTFAISVEGRDPAGVVSELGREGIFAWSGHYYAVSVMEDLGVAEEDGLVRIGFVHYNTSEEVARVSGMLAEMG